MRERRQRCKEDDSKHLHHIVKDKEIWEVANQLGGYVGPSTEDELADFLIRESEAAADLAYEIVRLLDEIDVLKGKLNE